MHKFFNTLLIFLFLCNLLYSQKKKYSGDFNAENGWKGVATYFYVDSIDKRIYDGKFNFETHDKKSFIDGSYLKNKKEGKWQYRWFIKGSFWVSPKDIYVKCSYKNGYLDGSFYSIDKSNQSDIKIYANFKKGRLTGDFKYVIGDSYIITGQFDEDGYMDGKWEVFNSYYGSDKMKLIITYKHGIEEKIKEVNESKGDVGRWESETNLDAFFENYNKKTGFCLLNGEYYYIKDVYIGSSWYRHQSLLVYMEYDFDFNLFGGWDYFTKGDKTNRYAPIRDFVKIDSKQLSQIKKFKINQIEGMIKAEEYFQNKNHGKAKEYYQQILNKKDSIDLFLAKEIDFNLISKRINECGNKLDIFYSLVKQGDGFFSMEIYDQAISKYEAALEISYFEVIEKEINKIKEIKSLRFYEYHIKKADSLFIEKEYTKAIDEYKNSIEYAYNKIDYPQNRIVEANNKISLMKYDYHIKKADSLFSKQQRQKAITQYEKAKEYSDNQYPNEKINQINEQIRFIKKRKTTIFKYSDYNPQHWEEIKLLMSQDVTKEALLTNTVNAEIKYAFHIDTIGKSQNSMEYTGSLQNQHQFSALTEKHQLKPTIIDSFTINASDTLKFSIEIKPKQIYKVTIKNGKTVIEDKDTTNKSSILGILENHPEGEYTIQIHKKGINKVDYSNNRVLSYQYFGKPSNAFLSLLVPGLGNKKVGLDKSGWSSFLISYGFFGIGAGAKYFSMHQYDLYQSATNQVDIDKHYELANGANYFFYSCVAIGTITWINNIYEVATKGFENKKNAKKNRAKMELSYLPNNNNLVFSYNITF